MVLTLLFTVPVALASVHTCGGLLGWVLMVTLYMAPEASGVGKVKGTLFVPLTVTVSVPLLSKTSPEPSNPETLPPTVNTGTQVTWIFVTLAVALPEGFVTPQFCAGLEGCVLTMTL